MKGKNTNREQTGGTNICVCPECGYEEEHNRGEPCNKYKCPECNIPLTGLGTVGSKLKKALVLKASKNNPGKIEKAKWEKAKGIVKRQYPNYDEESENFWKLTNSIYQAMKSTLVDLPIMEKALLISLEHPAKEVSREFIFENYYLLKAHFEKSRKLQGRIKFQGMDISIENRKGSVRKGTDPDGNEWQTKMKIPYGYIRLTEGADGDHVDCFIGDNKNSEKVFVVHQNFPDSGKYDEDKVMLGFDNAEDARKAYYDHYDEPDKFFGNIQQFEMDDFQNRVKRKKGKITKALLKAKKYSKEDLKAKNMRWITIRGNHILVQALKDGSYVVVGGGKGALNHFVIDKLLTPEEYQKESQQRRKEEIKELSAEEMKKQVAARKEEISLKKEARALYQEQIKKIVGVDFISKPEIGGISEEAKKIVSKQKEKLTDEEREEKTQEEEDKLLQKKERQKVRQVEKEALDALITDYMGDDLDLTQRQELKNMLDIEKAKEVLAARRVFKKTLKEITSDKYETPTKLKMGETFGGLSSRDIDDETIKEIEQHVETAKNIQLYEKLNAQALSIQKYIDEGALSSLNGITNDLYKVGTIFSYGMIESLGVEACARLLAAKLHGDGKAEVANNILKKFAAKNNMKIVDTALRETDKRFENADEIRDMAVDTDDAAAILSKASANGYALRQITRGQQVLGSAVGSLRSPAHIINALEEGAADSVLVDVGIDLARARKKMQKIGLKKGEYSIRTKDKRLVVEIPKETITAIFERNVSKNKGDSKLDKIKMHESNNGYLPEGMNSNIKLTPAQEAGLRFFSEKEKVLLDFEAGTGKTSIAYAAAMEAIKKKGAKKVLIVTPAKLRSQFYKERKVFLNKEEQENVTLNDRGPTVRKENYKKDGIIITGHDQIRTDWQAIKEAGFDMIVMDEIHEMTNPSDSDSGVDSGRFKGMMQLKDIPLKIGMSGTNIKNSKKEFYKKINFIEPDHTLGTMAEFENKYKGLNQGVGAFQSSSNEAFRENISPWNYTQKNILNVKNTEKEVKVELTAQQRKSYRQSEALYVEEKSIPSKKSGAAARRDSRNYNILHNGSPGHNGKVRQIINLMDNVHPGEKAVVHTTGRKALQTLKESLEQKYGKGSVVEVHGDTSKSKTEAAKAAFNDPDSGVKFIVGTKSLEAGHNLQFGGTVTFNYDLPPTYASIEQRNKRIFRKGQDKDVSTYTLVSNSPFDISKKNIIEKKKREMEILGNPSYLEPYDESGLLEMLNNS